MAERAQGGSGFSPVASSGAALPRSGRLRLTHAQHISRLDAQGMRREARQALAAAARLPADDPADLEAIGFIAFQIGAHEIARDCYQRFCDAAPGDALGWYNLATALRNTGALDDAEAACDKALALDPMLAQAALLRAHVRTQGADAHHVDALRRTLAMADDSGTEALFLHYALGKELEDLGDFDAAFAHYGRGAAIRRHSLRYDVREDVAKIERIIESFSAKRLAASPPLAREISHGFIIGLPRSGTTMVERVLTGAPTVASNGETDLLLAALMAGTPPEGGDIFDRVAAADPERVAPAYRRMAGPFPPASLILEKLPMNYLYAGAIRLTLPTARIILVERAPIDNCFAMYSTLFGSGYPFSYDFRDLAIYHRAYRKLVDHWSATLGDPFLRVDYQAFVADPLGEGARAARHMGIGWNDAMAAIERNRSASATASASQIRRPIYTSAVGRAARFGRHLEPLAELLAEG